MNTLYYLIKVRVTIAERVQFEVVKSVTIKNSLQQFFDAAKVELPREFKDIKIENRGTSVAGKNIRAYIHEGDSIRIEIGYDNQLSTEFEGYITEIGAETPLIIKAEDEMCQLQRGELLSRTFDSVTLKELLQFIAPGYESVCADVPLGKLMIERKTPYQVLSALKEKYSIQSYFKGKVLHSGWGRDFSPQNRHNFIFGKNIRKSSQLKYLTKEKREVRVKAISIQKGTSKKNTYEFGTNISGEITLHAPLNLTPAQLKEWAVNYYNHKVYEGFEGSLETWGVPRTRAGDSSHLKDPNYPDEHRDGTYLIDSVTITLDKDNGFKRKNTLSYKL